MKTIALTILAFLCVFAAQGQTPSIQPGTDILVTTGVSFDYMAHQASSLSSVSFKAASIAGLPTYSTTTFETTSLNLSKGISSALSVKTGVTQIVWAPSPNSFFWVSTVAGIAKMDFATLGNLEGSVGFSYDVGARLTKGKYHVYLSPVFREVSVASLQVKPVYALQFGTGFKKD